MGDENINVNDKLLILNEFGGIRADKVTNYNCQSDGYGGVEVKFYFGTDSYHHVQCKNGEEAKKLIKRYKKLIGVYDE